MIFEAHALEVLRPQAAAVGELLAHHRLIAEQLDAKLDSVIKASNRGKAFTRIDSADGVTRIALVERRIA